MADNVLEIKFTGDGSLPGERAGQPRADTSDSSYRETREAREPREYTRVPQPTKSDSGEQDTRVPRVPRPSSQAKLERDAERSLNSYLNTPYRLQQTPGVTKDPRALREAYKLADDPVQEKTREEIAAHELEMRRQREEWVHKKIIADMPKNLEKHQKMKDKEAEEEMRIERRRSLIRGAAIGAAVGAGIKGLSQVFNDNIEIGKKMTGGDVMGAELQRAQQPFKAVSSAANIVPIIGPAIAGIVDGIGDLFTASKRRFMAEDAAFRQESARLSMYSPAVATAEGRAQERDVRTSLLESNAIGDKLGKLTELQSKLDATLKLQSLIEKLDKIDSQSGKTDSENKDRIGMMELELKMQEMWGLKSAEEVAERQKLIDDFKKLIGDGVSDWLEIAQSAAERGAGLEPFHLEMPDFSWTSAANKNGGNAIDRSRLNQPILGGFAGVGG